jgi:hypothetical protein
MGNTRYRLSEQLGLAAGVIALWACVFILFLAT